MSKTTSERAPVGSQTLARGLHALLTVVDRADGVTVNQLAENLDVHRTVAYRILKTLVSFGFVTHGSDGVYRAGPRLATLADAYLPALRQAAIPVMRELADEIGCTVSLFIADREQAVSVALVEPTTGSHHLRFRAGMRTPIDRGCAGYALLAAGPPVKGEPAPVTRARRRGYATSAGEVETGAYGVAAPIPNSNPPACVNLITHQKEQAKAAEKCIVDAVKKVEEALELADFRE